MSIKVLTSIEIELSKEVQIKFSELLAPTNYKRDIIIVSDKQEDGTCECEVNTTLCSLDSILYDYRYNQLKLDDDVLDILIDLECKTDDIFFPDSTLVTLKVEQ